MAYLREYDGHDRTLEMLSLPNLACVSWIHVRMSITQMRLMVLICGSLDG
jgi:hypothetical protein